MKLRPGLLHRTTDFQPAFLGAGVFGASSSGGSLAMPAGTGAGDVMLMLLETNPGEPAALPAGGWAHVANSPFSDAGGILSVFWLRCAGSEPASYTIADAGDHVSGIILAFRRVKNTGNPWNATASGTSPSGGAARTAPGLTTTVSQCLVVNCVGTGAEVSSTTEFSAWTNASLASITEIVDAVSTVGDGTGLGVAYGIKLAAGVVSATAFNVVTTTSASHCITVALEPG